MRNHVTTARGLTAALLVVAAAACTADRAPTAPATAAAIAPPLFSGDPFTGDPNEVTVLVKYLFVDDEAAALRESDQIVNNRPSSAAACSATALLLTRTFQDYRELRLYGQQDANGPDLTFPRPQVQQLVRRLSLNCPALAPSDTVPNGALDVNGAAAVIRAGQGGTVETIPGPDGQAGVRVPAGTFNQDVVLYIVPKPPASQLPTTLPQYAPYYDIYVLPEQPKPYRYPLDIGFVVVWPTRPPSDHLVIGHALTPSTLEVLQPIFLTTPSSGVGQFGGPAYLKPPAAMAAARSAASAATFGTLAAAKSTTTSYGGQASSLSPFGLVSIFQSGVNPNAAVAFDPSRCAAPGAAVIPYTVNTTSDIVLNYQELTASGAANSVRKLLYVRGLGTGTPRAETLTLKSGTARVRFYFGATLFTTRTAASC